MGDDFRIFFVKPDKNEENSSTLVEAFETLLKADYSFKPEWISPEDCLSMDGKGKQIYILDPFEGTAFEHLKKMGYRIYGPRCILANLLHGMELPKNKKRPIYNLAMKGIKICCTSIDRATRDEIMIKVHLMGGEMDSNLTADVTHLIAGEVGSNKYLVAADKGKHVMLKDWINKVWELSQDKHILGTDDIFEKYVCPPFLGLTVVVSGFSNHERNQMRGFVVRGGGKYSGELKMNECTHLVVKEPKGAKYEAAKNWRIRIVKDRWLFESMDKGRYLDPKPFQFDGAEQSGDVKTSTPERRSTMAPHISDISAIANGGSNNSMQRVDETTDLTSTRFSEQFGAAGRNLEVGETRISATSGDPDATVTPVDIFLDGCRIYLSGMKSAVAEKLRKIITAGGGLRAMEIKENTTHVILGEVVTSDLLLLNSLQECPLVVTPDWLMDCFHQNVHLSEEKYLRCDLGLKMIAKSDRRKTDENSAQGQNSRKDEEKREESNNKMNERQEDKAQDTETFRQDAPSDLEMAELLSQYMENAESTKSDVVQVEANSDEGNITVKAHEALEDEEVMTQDPNDITAEDEVGRGIFHKKTFVILGFDEDETTQLSEFVESKGGHITSNMKRRHVADIAIVPLMGFPVDCTVSEILTNAWLQMCIENDELLPYDEYWLSRPIELPDAEPLTGCCISVSGYVGVERECLMHLAEALGATVQDHFARRSNKNVKASTHLIVNHPSGPKYNAAKKWKLPAVGKEWIFACIRNREQTSVDEYLIEYLEEKRAETEQGCTDNIMEPRESASNIDKTKNSSTSSLPTPPPVSNKNDSVFVRDEEAQGRGTVMSEGGQKTFPEGKEDVHSGNSTPGGEQSRSKGKPQEIEEAIPTSSAESSESGRNTAMNNPMADIQHRLSAVATPSGSPVNPVSSKKSACKPNQSENITAGSMKTPVGVTRQKWGKSTPASATSTSTPLGLIRGGGETPGTFMHPDFRPKFNAVFTTPDNAADLDKSTPLGEIFRRQITKAAQNGSAECEDNEMLASQSQSGELAPLHGVVIAVAKKLGRSHEQYNGIVVELGGDYSWHNGQHVTHFVFQGRLNDTNKEFRKAREEKKIIVSPHWLFACKEQNCRVDESLYPHNYNPSYSLTMTPGQKTTPSRSSRALARNKVQNEFGSQTVGSNCGKTPNRKMPVLNIQEVHKKVETPTTPKAAETTKDSPITKNVNLQDSHQDRQCTDNSTNDQGSVTVEAPQKETSVSAVSLADSRNTTNEGSSEKSKNQEMKEALTKTLGTVLADASRSRRTNRRKGKRINLSGQLNASDGNTPENHLAVVGASSWANKNPKPDTVQPEPSQSLQVTWDDPTERLEKEKLAHRLERVCEPSQNTEDLLAAIEMPEDIPSESSVSHISGVKPSSRLEVHVNTRSPTPEPPPLAFPVAASRVLSPQPVELLSEESSDSRTGPTTKTVPVFLISGMQNYERVDYSALVEQLGGKMVEKQHFDPSSTHLVVGQPARNEKYLSCVASGKWVLHKSYFEACRKENKFVKEEPHEWGSEFTIPLMQNMTAQANKLAAAAHKWRKKVTSIRKIHPSCQGAFDDWTVLLCLDKSKEENFQRLLEAGGAKVSTIRPPFPADINGSHAFIDLNKMKIPQEDLEKLIQADVHCLKTEFIPAYLTDEPPPDPSEFYPAEVVALKACMPEPSQKRKRRLASDDSSTSSKTRRR